jgi:hypothetical protein
LGSATEYVDKQHTAATTKRRVRGVKIIITPLIHEISELDIRKAAKVTEVF